MLQLLTKITPLQIKHKHDTQATPAAAAPLPLFTAAAALGRVAILTCDEPISLLVLPAAPLLPQQADILSSPGTGGCLRAVLASIACMQAFIEHNYTCRTSKGPHAPKQCSFVLPEANRVILVGTTRMVSVCCTALVSST
jgi:hypothetical protein